VDRQSHRVGLDPVVRNVVVFGIAGFCGKHFERFVANGAFNSHYRFFGFARTLTSAEHSGAFTYREGDACDEAAVRDFVSEVKPAYILNLIGVFRAQTYSELLSINVGVSQTICEAVLRSRVPVKNIVLVGSAAEYGRPARNPVSEDAELRPVTHYGLSKVYQTLLASYYFRNYRLPVVVARTFNIVGEGLSSDLSVGNFMRQLRELSDGGVMKVGNICTRRDFLDIRDVSRRYWHLLMSGAAGEIYNVCSGSPKTIRSVVEALIRETGKRISVDADPALFKENDIESIYGDNSKYQRLAQ